LKKLIIILILLGLVVINVIFLILPRTRTETQLEILKNKYSKKDSSSVRHSDFEILKRKFSKPQDVTESCLHCHNGRGQEVLESNHWNWEEPTYIEGKGVVYLGKRNAINNYCLGSEGNELACAKCHIGYGMQSVKTFDFEDVKNIDCLICHDNTETYAKAQEKGGEPESDLDFSYIAQNVGKPKRSNCGVCHFYGGGGNNVKHGDLEKSMFEPTRDIDVHMGIEGSNLQCVDCHTSEKHKISGRLYSLASTNTNRLKCEKCHYDNPHSKNILNEHCLKVACQTCHIPIYAKVNATKTEWDWSTAGKLKDGEPYEINDEEGNHIYLSTKGSFKWGKQLKPDYVWFNGTADHYLKGDIINDPTKPVILNKLNGSYKDRESKIYPVKIMKTNQCYDSVYKILTIPKLFDPKLGTGAFWKDFDCLKALDVGMKELGLPFSGTLAFINTKMYWPINHMVSTKDKSVQCKECHTKNNSRLAELTDFYLPGRDSNKFVEIFGNTIIILTFFGVIIHGTLRIIINIKRKKTKKDED